MKNFDEWWDSHILKEHPGLDEIGMDSALTRRIARRAWAAAQPKWQPIETAPKGVYSLRRTDPEWAQPPLILLFIPGCAIYPEGHKVAALWDYYYDKDIGGRGYEGNKTAWVTPYGELVEDNYDGEPTHWMPLPQPP